MTHVFKHPKFLKELRKLRNKLDQAISNSYAIKDSSDKLERAPGPGLKLQASSSIEPQASSNKPQAPSTLEQGSSHKRQAP